MYDQGLQLETHCSVVTAGKVEHSYRLIRSSDGELLAEGSTVLAHVNAEGKVRRIPGFMFPAKDD
jgi:acyl-CoA thioesterase FadM